MPIPDRSMDSFQRPVLRNTASHLIRVGWASRGCNPDFYASLSRMHPIVRIGHDRMDHRCSMDRHSYVTCCLIELLFLMWMMLTKVDVEHVVDVDG